LKKGLSWDGVIIANKSAALAMTGEAARSAVVAVASKNFFKNVMVSPPE
jgi:hypothetical protein